MMRGMVGVRKSIHQTWWAKGLGLLCWVFKGVQEEIPSEVVSTLQIGSRKIHQSSTPSLSQNIWPRWASRQFVSLPIVQTLLPVTFVYTLSSEAVIMRQMRRWKGCDEGHWHSHTSVLPCGLSEVIGSLQHVHWSRRRLLRRGLEFHMCTINKSGHTKKSGNLFNDPRICIFICVCVHKTTYIYINVNVCYKPIISSLIALIGSKFSESILFEFRNVLYTYCQKILQ